MNHPTTNDAVLLSLKQRQLLPEIDLILASAEILQDEGPVGRG